MAVPLSEDEQRILQEIERSFYESDPAFAREVSAAVASRHASRNVKVSAVVFVLALVALVLSFATSAILGFAWFLVMVGSAWMFQHNVRKLGRPAWTQRPDRPGDGKTAGVSNMLGSQRDRLKGRLRKRDDD